MGAIQFAEQATGVRVNEQGRALARAAVAALAAPSILNTQPWRWRISGNVAELRADDSRKVDSLDPDARLLVLSCGIALHHARVALAAEGVRVEVAYLPDDGDGEGPLATIRYTGKVEIGSEARRLRRAMATRHTDRRPFADTPVPDSTLEELRHAAESAGAHLHLPRSEDIVTLTVAAGHAASAERADPAYLAELAEWVRRADGGTDGVPVTTTVPSAARPVPIREFVADGVDRSTVHDGLTLVDRHARYAVVFTDGDTQRDWLAAGEALSAILLTATVNGLATSPMSDLVEVASSRALLRAMLAAVGYPAIVVRIGLPATIDAPVPAAPRRAPAEVIEFERATSD